MIKKTNLLIIAVIINIGLFGYLTYHHYSLKLGLETSQLCQISETVNCDTAAQSSYSEVFNIPIALLGLIFSIMFLIYSLALRWNWLDNNSFNFSIAKILLLFNAALSLLLGFVSLTILKVVCPFCIATYVITFVQLYAFWLAYPVNLKAFKISNFSDNYGTLIIFGLIPIFSWAISSNIEERFGLDKLKQIIPEKIALWQSRPAQKFDTNLGLVKGNLDGTIALVEFADFKCPHCKVAAKSLALFVKNSSNVIMTLKPFPLDGNCNPHVSFKGDNTRCIMAGWALCAEKIEKKGWAVHDWFFNNQDRLMPISNLTSELKSMSSVLQINFDQINSCAESAETFSLIQNMSNEGHAAQVEGTPSIYLNQRKLDYGHFGIVLKEAISTIK